jgi:hypothetical protein
MPRKKKKQIDPLARFKETATILQDGEFPYEGTSLVVVSIENGKSGGFFCTLKKTKSPIVYSHVEPGTTKLRAIMMVLLELESMGNGGLSNETDEDYEE